MKLSTGQIAYRGIALPVFWTVLDKPGNSNTAERKALMERFLAVFGAARITVLLADREVVGEAWFRWLQARRIPFHQRIKCDTLVPNHGHRMMRVDRLLASLKPGQAHLLPGRRPVWGCFVHLSALRLDDGERLILATSGASPHEAIDAYADRWQVEIYQPYNRKTLLAITEWLRAIARYRLRHALTATLPTRLYPPGLATADVPVG